MEFEWFGAVVTQEATRILRWTPTSSCAGGSPGECQKRDFGIAVQPLSVRSDTNKFGDGGLMNRHHDRCMMLRRLIAVLMVAPTTFSLGRLSGELRDGEVHHETAATASSPSKTSSGDHGHEDDSSHGSEHQHGTSGDRFTHQRGPLLVGVSTLREAILAKVASPILLASPPLDRSVEPFVCPPRALPLPALADLPQFRTLCFQTTDQSRSPVADRYQ